MDSYKGYEIFYTSGLLSDKMLSDVQLNSHMTFFVLLDVLVILLFCISTNLRKFSTLLWFNPVNHKSLTQLEFYKVIIVVFSSQTDFKLQELMKLLNFSEETILDLILDI